MTKQASKLKKIVEDIRIIKAGYLSENINISSLLEIAPSFVLIVSRSNHTRLKIDDETVNLFDSQMIIYSLNYIRQLTIVRGEGVFINLKGTLVERYIQNDMINKIIFLNLNDRINKSIAELEAKLKYDKSIEPVSAGKIGFSILLDLWTYQTKTKYMPRLIKDTIKIIEHEYAYIFGVEDLADKAGVNKSYLIRIFKENLKVTPGQYLEKYRINKAKELLSSGEFNVDMVAKLCGYSCANYFAKVFKKHTCVSPSTYLGSISENVEPDIPPEYYL